ncbi:GvpL/GvpF family gas vesicle protein [Bradyrhizobium sp. WD16]|uniref:GvpL/GvpF family gas vesicle protein n=1 Tax=Bradyrhizobium sp. WD16 TaxID=1521768 RepID=UPI0020A44458|nr:GvpL/GvpF family gas vesicle protein [Bradyrhizobium sp. WD16]UTD29189.1 hypothetical protein DB459_22040 [Bradyrhizobium sp. WD16]
MEHDLALPQGGADARHQASDQAVCLFAFVAESAVHDMRLPDDVCEQRLMLHRVGSVAALIGIVPLSDYSGADAERRFADVAWLAPRVRRHAELVEWAMQAAAVFPAPFGTLYTNLDSLGAFMQAHEGTIADFLRAVTGKEEWDLRALARFDSPEILDQLARSAWPDLRALSKGARYMKLCRDRSALLAFGRDEAAGRARQLLPQLEPLTAGIRQLGSGAVADSGGAELVARYALLVAKTDAAALQDQVRELGDRVKQQNLALVLSGPWPPFSFRPNLNSLN